MAKPPQDQFTLPSSVDAAINRATYIAAALVGVVVSVTGIAVTLLYRTYVHDVDVLQPAWHKACESRGLSTAVVGSTRGCLREDGTFVVVYVER